MQAAAGFKLTAKQEEACAKMASPATNIFLYGGARSAKTFTAIRAIVTRALIAPGSRHVALRHRLSHIKSSIIYDTFPKVMTLCFPGVIFVPNKTDMFVAFPNGSEIWFGGLDDKDRTEKILGNEYATIFLNEISQIAYHSYLLVRTRLAQRVKYTDATGTERELRLKLYCDANPPQRGHWSHKTFIELVDAENRNRKLPDADDYCHLLMNPRDNAENLPAKYMSVLDALPKRQRLRFRDGVFGDDSEGALWTHDLIELHKLTSHQKEFVRIAIAVDPSGASGKEEEKRSDDIGIMVGGLDVDGDAVLLADLTVNAGPGTWGRVVAAAYERYSADRVIGESNYGGAMVEFVVRTAEPNISYKAVVASRGKMIRAEPVSALHEQGRIKFLGDFHDLEDELLNATTAGYIGTKSPNRLDAFVFLITELLPTMTKRTQVTESDIIIPATRFY